MSLLEANGMNSFYGDSHILFDISMTIGRNEVVALLGRNGAGKTTTLRALSGVVSTSSGSIRLNGKAIEGLQPYEIARLGLQLVPEERCIFTSLTVRQNLELAAMTAPAALPIQDVFQIFPRLRERQNHKGGNLSGGEQQMLAIARAIIRDAQIILLDEPFEGLAPVIVRDLVGVCKSLADDGRTIVIVEQNVPMALALADRCYVLNNGHVVFQGSSAQLRGEPDVIHRYLGVGIAPDSKKRGH